MDVQIQLSDRATLSLHPRDREVSLAIIHHLPEGEPETCAVPLDSSAAKQLRMALGILFPEIVS